MPRSDLPSRDQTEATGSLAELLEQLAGMVRRQLVVVIAAVAASLAIGVVYLIVTPPMFTATATLLIDSSKAKGPPGQPTAVSDYSSDAALIESQVEILKSRSIALAVVEQLSLAESPEFSTPRGGVSMAALGLSGGGSAGRPASSVQAAVDVFLENRSVVRVGKTYALDISYTSRDPARAATIANALAEAYIVDQLDAKYQSTRRASGWLQARLEELKAQAIAARQAVLEYKEKKNIVDIGGPQGSGEGGGDGRLVTEQQLSELNTQLVTARVATGEAKAKLDRIDDILSRDVDDSTVAESLRSDVVNSLRKSYLDYATREASWSARYGQDHAAAIELRAKMNELRRAIRDELGRMAAGFRSDYEIARAREQSLQKALAGLVSEGQLTNRDRLGLIDLESSAKVYRSIHDTFLQRYMEAIQQQSFPFTEARVIGAADPPTRKSRPATSLVLAIAGTMGLMAGFGIAALREGFDKSIRTRRQIEIGLGTTCLCVLPTVPRAGETRSARWSWSSRPPRPGPRAGHGAVAMPAPGRSDAGDVVADHVDADHVDADHVVADHVVAWSDPTKRLAVKEPLSAFAEGLRAVKVAVELAGAIERRTVIGVTSSLPGEGKSTVAANLAGLMAHAGRRVILIDADLRNPTFAGCLAPAPAKGLADVLGGGCDVTAAIVTDPESGLSILPALPDDARVHTDEIVASPQFRALLDRLEARYDWVVVDLPPIGPVVDVRAAAQAIGSFVFVVEWARTPLSVAQACLAAAPEVRDRMIGAVLNKADLARLDRFEPHMRYGRDGYYVGGRRQAVVAAMPRVRDREA